MEALLLQAEDSVETRNSEAQENSGRNYEFDKYLEGMCLRPIYFVSRSTVSPLENSRHIFVGEAATLRWAIGKFIKYLLVAEFIGLSDFSGI